MSARFPADRSASRLHAVRHLDHIDRTLALNEHEMTLLKRNGFVASDRLVFEKFKRAYAYIYWRDLPVLVTTDSILHALHVTYDEMLKAVEVDILAPRLRELLQTLRDYLSERASLLPDVHERALWNDLITYLDVPLTLLPDLRTGKASEAVKVYTEPIQQVNLSPGMAELVILPDGTLGSREAPPVGVQEVTLFGLSRPVDFTLFRARGHYTDSLDLMAYFAAFMWLSLIDFRIVELDRDGQARVQRDQLRAAQILHDALNATGQRQNWEAIDQFLNAFIGWSDNVTLRGMDQLLDDLGTLLPDDAHILDLLTRNDYGRQRIRGPMEYTGKADSALEHGLSFALFGQRFTLESFAIQQIVYDKLVVDGVHVPRAYPNPLDVMAVIGNRRATDHLTAELAQYGYGEKLMALRDETASLSHEFWESNLYNLWLDAIRSLNVLSDSPHCPKAMRGTAWADKMLQTQLAAWAQLRHDNVLYAKPPHSPRVGCDFSAGYVEPYPDFFAAIARYARFGRALFTTMPTAKAPEHYLAEVAEFQESGYPFRSRLPNQYRPYALRQKLVAYFEHLESTACVLEGIARKEIQGESLSPDDELFLRSVMVRKYVGETGYGGYTEEHWNGWYNGLLPFDEDGPEVVADLYTNLDDQIGPPGVMHLGTGKPEALIVMVEDGEATAAYIGPAYSYYEHFEQGYPPHRLTDEEWSALVNPPHARARRIYAEWASEPGAREDVRAEYEAEAHRAEQEFAAAAERCLRPPAWTASFRVAQRSLRHLDMPSLLEALGLDAEVWKAVVRFTDVFAEKRLSPVQGLRELLLTRPVELLAVPGFDRDKLAALVQNMRINGHLSDEEVAAITL